MLLTRCSPDNTHIHMPQLFFRNPSNTAAIDVAYECLFTELLSPDSQSYCAQSKLCAHVCLSVCDSLLNEAQNHTTSTLKAAHYCHRKTQLAYFAIPHTDLSSHAPCETHYMYIHTSACRHLFYQGSEI